MATLCAQIGFHEIWPIIGQQSGSANQWRPISYQNKFTPQKTGAEVLIKFLISDFLKGSRAHSAMHYAMRAMGAVSLRQKKEELESKNSHKSDI